MIEIAIILAIGILMTLLLLIIFVPVLVFSETTQDDNQINKEYSDEWKKIQSSLTKLEKALKNRRKNGTRKSN